MRPNDLALGYREPAVALGSIAEPLPASVRVADLDFGEEPFLNVERVRLEGIAVLAKSLVVEADVSRQCVHAAPEVPLSPCGAADPDMRKLGRTGERRQPLTDEVGEAVEVVVGDEQPHVVQVPLEFAASPVRLAVVDRARDQRGQRAARSGRSTSRAQPLTTCRTASPARCSCVPVGPFVVADTLDQRQLEVVPVKLVRVPRRYKGSSPRCMMRSTRRTPLR